MTGLPLDDPVFRCLCLLDSFLCRVGWGNQNLPRLYRLNRRNPVIEMTEIRNDIPGNPTRFVHYLGHQLAEHPNEDNILAAQEWAEGGFYGAVLATEGSEIDPTSKQPTGDMLRLIHCVDIRGKVFALQRRRKSGEQFFADENEPGLHGSSLEGLRLLCIAVSRHINDDDVDLDALMRLDLLAAEDRERYDNHAMDELF